MNYPFYLARRLSLGSDGKKISPSVGVAIASIAVSIAVMIASIAIVLGFKKEIRNKVVGFNGHITLYKILNSPQDNNLLTLTPYLEETLSNFPFITDYNVQVSIPAILKTPDNFKGVYFKGLNGVESIKYLEKNLEEGEIPNFTDEEQNLHILISRTAANQLELNVGDEVETYFITDEVRVRKLKISGIYNSHFNQYDDVLIFGSMPLLAQIGKLPEKTGTYLSIYTNDFDKILEHSYELQGKLNEDAAYGHNDIFYRIDNVLNQGRGFFSWLSLLDTNVLVIIILMMIVGCVTLISGMLIIILERKRFIGLMRALGAPTSKIRAVFIYMAIRIAFIGLIIGDIIICVTLYLQDKYHFLHLDAEAYYIDFVPVYLPDYIVVALNTGVIVVVYAVLVLPSRFVGKISPAESLVNTE